MDRKYMLKVILNNKPHSLSYKEMYEIYITAKSVQNIWFLCKYKLTQFKRVIMHVLRQRVVDNDIRRK